MPMFWGAPRLPQKVSHPDMWSAVATRMLLRDIALLLPEPAG
jgi:hypothetical protein